MSEEANNFASSAIGEQGELKLDLTDICAQVKNIEDFDDWFEGWIKFCKQKNVQQLHINPNINAINVTLPELQKIAAIAQKLINDKGFECCNEQGQSVLKLSFDPVPDVLNELKHLEIA